jgi:hypothetical protein
MTRQRSAQFCPVLSNLSGSGWSYAQFTAEATSGGITAGVCIGLVFRLLLDA